MQRDWEVIRKILLKIEALPAGGRLLSGDLIDDGIDNATAAYHMGILKEAGLIVGTCLDAGPASTCNVSRLTWDGHEFLDGIERDTTWNKVKDAVRAKGFDLGFDAIKAAVKYLVYEA